MIIRDAVAADAAELAAIAEPIVRETTISFSTVVKSAEDFALEIAERQEAGRAFLVAEDAGQVLGYATYFPFRSGPGYARTMEHTILLGPAARGRGAGRALMDRLCDHAAAAGIHIMVAGVCAQNAPGLAFHRAIGFVETGRMPETGWKFGRWLDLVLLQKRLDDGPPPSTPL
ncbi:GNAT family N-acetyltransferase [Poseidonocella sedimentorum]|uniref:Phosphinothricin acetyltransferase n=1 Tax=Poseidonocella sedimentorum TaxID=871652 RepID=A0A1I6CT95_9RHOB|nr:GNAT family N-acetyltransferase [Poseidonocella sedimentorum]SFQ96332.1 phosphinothricin acetyltransferase [Poseidonocella sedimentorum]